MGSDSEGQQPIAHKPQEIEKTEIVGISWLFQTPMVRLT
jgi:hypothetical protein